MKKLLIFGIICIQINLFAVVELNDTDKVVKSVVYVHSDPDNVGSPLQAEVKKVKIKELDKHNRISISKNIDHFIDEAPAPDNKLSLIAKRLGITFQGTPMQLGRPVYVNGFENAIRQMPALDQAETDTCATFSATAAVDILAGNGKDIYSNYMSLCLGQAIALKLINASTSLQRILNFVNEDSFSNPWEGTEGIIILKQFEDYGLVKQKDKNSQNGRFGEGIKKKPLSKKQLKRFKRIAKLRCRLIYHDKICDIQKVFKTKKDFVNIIKEEITKGNIVSIGIALASEFKGSNNGMIGNTKIIKDHGSFTNSKQRNPANYNTWCSSKALGKYIKKYMKDDNLIGSHQMIIIGYIDSIKNPDDGIFILRNSWGSDCGHNGNNYVTYKYAYRLSDELISISVGKSSIPGYL